MASWNRFLIAGLLCCRAEAQEQEWRAPGAEAIIAPARTGGPILACTRVELDRLRAALRGGGEGARIAKERVRQAREHLATPVEFPPRGGQHNQWYQCDACQIALETVDAGHHRCPECRKVHAGAPYDDVLFTQVHSRNQARALDAAWAFALTGEAAFGADAAAILLGYADRYESYPYHSNSAPGKRPAESGGHLHSQTLTEASAFASQLAPAIDLVWPRLDETQREHVLNHLVRPLVSNVAKCSRGRSNWQTWHNAAMFAGGVLLGESAWMQRSVLAPKQGFTFQMSACVSAEGMWYENSWGYHFYTLRALALHADAARVAGFDLWAAPPLRRMVALPARCTLADGTLPRLGDDTGTTAAGAGAAVEAAFAATRDPELSAVLPRTPGFESLRFGREVPSAAPQELTTPRSEVLRGAGLAFLRRGRGPDAASAMLAFGPFGGGHGHFDKLSFVWHALGTERGVDPGRAQSQAYRLPVHNGWYRATLAHNAVVVDGKSQPGAGGELLAFVDTADFAAAAARTGAYAGVDHRRCLLLDDRCLVVFDLLRGDGKHTFDFVYHDASTRVDCAVADSQPDAALGAAGEEFVRWLGAGRTEGPVAARFHGGPITTRLLVAGGAAAEVRCGTGPFRSVSNRLPFVLLRRSGATALFATVLQAQAGDSDSATSLQAAWAGDGVEAVLVMQGKRSTITWDGGGDIAWRNRH